MSGKSIPLTMNVCMAITRPANNRTGQQYRPMLNRNAYKQILTVSDATVFIIGDMLYESILNVNIS